jgi:hypothetical protein
MYLKAINSIEETSNSINQTKYIFEKEVKNRISIVNYNPIECMALVILSRRYLKIQMKYYRRRY